MNFIRNRDNSGVSPVIAVILMVAITVVLASVLYVYVNSLVDTTESVEKFGVIEVEIYDSTIADYMRIKLISGDNLNWTIYKIIITNTSDESDKAIMLTLTGEQSPGEWLTFNAGNAQGFDDINFQFNKFYDLEVYHIQKSKRVFMESNILVKIGT